MVVIFILVAADMLTMRPMTELSPMAKTTPMQDP